TVSLHIGCPTHPPHASALSRSLSWRQYDGHICKEGTQLRATLCVCVCVSSWCECLSVNAFLHVCACVCGCLCVCVCICMHACVCMCVCVCVCVYGSEVLMVEGLCLF